MAKQQVSQLALKTSSIPGNQNKINKPNSFVSLSLILISKIEIGRVEIKYPPWNYPILILGIFQLAALFFL